MKYYSEQLSKFYDTPEACEAAEAEASAALEAKKSAENDAKTQLQAQQNIVNGRWSRSLQQSWSDGWG